MFLKELMTLLPSGWVPGRDVFASSKAALPSGGTRFLKIIQTGGPPPIRTHNSVITPAYVRPTAQFIAVAARYEDADTMAKQAYDSLVGRRNIVVSGDVFYREINPLQEPFDLGLDQNGRAQVAFNIMAIKRPS